MSLVLGVVLAASAATVPACSWDRPNGNPYQGDVAAAVERYADIPAPVRERLKQRMAARRYDEIAAIRRDAIEGRHAYTDLRQMHFGQGQICLKVSRTRWAESAVERGLVYCEGEHCLIVPTVCRNVSRVTRMPGPSAAGAGAGSGLVGADPAPPGELVFDPPSAGGRADTRQRLASFAEGAGLAAAEQAAPREAADGSFGELVRTLDSTGGGSDDPATVTAARRGGSVSGGGWLGLGAGPGSGAGERPPHGGPGRPGDLYGPPLPAGLPGQPPVHPPAVPEPSTWTMLALGLALLAVTGRRGQGAAA